jgi:hypothetical protein
MVVIATQMPPPDTNHGSLLPTWETPSVPYLPAFKSLNSDHCHNSTASQQVHYNHGYAEVNSWPISGVHPQQQPPYHLPLNRSSLELPMPCPPPGPKAPPSLPAPPYNPILDPNGSSIMHGQILAAPRKVSRAQHVSQLPE